MYLRITKVGDSLELKSLFINFIRRVDEAGDLGLIKLVFTYILATMDQTNAEQLIQQSVDAVKPKTGDAPEVFYYEAK